MKKRMHVYFEGMVQGVGFRFTAVEVARDFGIAGWVRNLDDGRVEVLAEGEEEHLESFLKNITGRFSRYIRGKEIEWTEAKGELNDFTVKF